MMNKFFGDPTSIISLAELNVKENLSYEEVLVEILVWQVMRLKNKQVSLFKLLWRNHLVERAIGRARRNDVVVFSYVSSYSSFW